MGHCFAEGKKSIAIGKLGVVKGSQDKANFVRAPLRLQEIVCTLFSAARSFPINGARRRFSYVAEDVTSRRRTETALRKHAARQTALLEVTRAIFNQNADRTSLAALLK